MFYFLHYFTIFPLYSHFLHYFCIFIHSKNLLLHIFSSCLIRISRHMPLGFPPDSFLFFVCFNKKTLQNIIFAEFLNVLIYFLRYSYAYNKNALYPFTASYTSALLLTSYGACILSTATPLSITSIP